MSANRRRPPFRSLDIYRLVVARRLKQLDVAKSFGVDPTRISQIVRRVRNWVNATIGDWLFPGREDFRFYVALEFLQIRVFELPHEPENVILTGPGGTYSRHDKTATDVPGWQPPAEAQGPLHPPELTNPQLALDMSAHPLTSTSQPNLDAFAATPDPAGDYLPPNILRLGTRMAQLLILWDKHHKSRDPMKALS